MKIIYVNKLIHLVLYLKLKFILMMIVKIVIHLVKNVMEFKIINVINVVMDII